MNEATLFWVVLIVSAVVVFYLIWSGQHKHQQRERKCDHQDLVLEIQRELLRQHGEMLSRCTELQRKLDDHHRTLRYVARRVS